jgi:hypothetical protein
MRLVKLSFLAILALLWWLVIFGDHPAPIDRRWIIVLTGLVIGFALGCIESKHTYATNDWSWDKALWDFPKDCFWVFLMALISSLLINLSLQEELIGFWIVPSMLTTAIYFGWPRQLTEEQTDATDE